MHYAIIPYINPILMDFSVKQRNKKGSKHDDINWRYLSRMSPNLHQIATEQILTRISIN